MKRSTKIALIVLCAPTIVSCSDGFDDVDFKQEKYKTEADCKREWSNSSDCRPRSAGGFIGPMYFYHHLTNQPYAVYADGSTKPISRSYTGLATETLTSSRSINSFSKPSPVMSGTAAASFSARTGAVSRGGFGSSARAGSSGG